jgi:membrane associated rhomboid family serine protease
MNPKRYLEEWIRGWLPKEPTLHQRTNSRISRTPRIRIALIFLGGFIGGLSGALSSSIGLSQGLGVHLWPIIIGIFVGTITAAILIRSRQKEEQQRSIRELKS